MGRKNIFLLLLTCLLSVVYAAPSPAPVVADQAEELSDAARQLSILDDSLSHQNEKTRINSAIALLKRDNSDSWAVLIKHLQADNSPLITEAICNGIINSRPWLQLNSKKTQFLLPLLSIIASEDPLQAILASRALLIFSYPDVSKQLKAMVSPENTEKQARINAVYALSLYSDDKSVIADLLKLLDDADPLAAAAAKTALEDTFGLLPDTELNVLKQVANDWQRKKPSQMLRELRTVQAAKMKSLQEENAKVIEDRDRWLSLYLGSLDSRFQVADAPGRADMVNEKITSKLSPEKIWALGKIADHSAGAPSLFKNNIFSLVADADSAVRVQAAKVLSTNSVLDPAAILLKQLQSENDSQAAVATLEALGEACDYALSPGSGIELAESIRNQTLTLAAEYLQSEDAANAKTGAEVIRKLLKFKGLDEGTSEKYLKLILSRMSREEGAKTNKTLKGQLLNEMAKLCEKNSVCRDAARGLYRSSFIAGLDSEGNDLLREAAVIGVENIDSVAAFSEFKKRVMYDDKVLAIRLAVIKLAGKLGTTDDVGWLSGKIGANGDSSQAWEAISQILGRQDSGTIVAWTDKFTDQMVNAKQILSLLEMAEKKAEAENNKQLLANIRGRLLNIYLASADNAKVVELMTKTLAAEKDIDITNPFASQLDAYFSKDQVEANVRTELLKALIAIKSTQEAPMWAETLEGWKHRLEPKPESKPVPATEPAVEKETAPPAITPAE